MKLRKILCPSAFVILGSPCILLFIFSWTYVAKATWVREVVIGWIIYCLSLASMVLWSSLIVFEDLIRKKGFRQAFLEVLEKWKESRIVVKIFTIAFGVCLLIAPFGWRADIPLLGYIGIVGGLICLAALSIILTSVELNKREKKGRE